MYITCGCVVSLKISNSFSRLSHCIVRALYRRSPTWYRNKSMHESRFCLTNRSSTLERNCSTLYPPSPLNEEAASLRLILGHNQFVGVICLQDYRFVEIHCFKRCSDHRSVCVSRIFLCSQPGLGVDFVTEEISKILFVAMVR